MRILTVAILLMSCGEPPPPIVMTLAHPTCGWVERKVYTASACEVIRSDVDDRARFRRLEDESCDGASVLPLCPGDSVVVLGPITEMHVDAVHSPVDCADLGCP